MSTHLEFDDTFKTGNEPSTVKGAVLREADIPDEGESRPYIPGIELEKFSDGRFSKAVADFSWNDQVSLEKRVTGITRTEIIEDSGERVLKAYDAGGRVVGVRKLLAGGLLE